MSRAHFAPGVLIIAPTRSSHGGISTVVGNYARTRFWHDFRCEHFPSTADFNTRTAKVAFDLSRVAAFAWRLAFGPRPWALSIHTAHDGSFYRKLAYIFIGRAVRVPVVLHVHPASFADFYRRGGRLRRSAVRLAGWMSDQVIVLSQGILDDLAEVFPRGKLSVLRNPVDVEAFATGPGPIRTSRPRILFLGWIIADKGVYDIVDAMPSVLQDYPDAIFTFAGSKEIDRLRKLIVQRGLGNSAEVPGWVEGQDKIDLLHNSRILVLPSYTEGVPNVILEAMASGLPIVTTPVGGIPSVLQHDETAIFVKPGDVAAIAAALKALLGDDGKCRSLAAAAFTRVSGEFSTAAVGLGLARIYGLYRPHAARA